MTTQLTVDEEVTVRILLNIRINECWSWRNSSPYLREELRRCVKLLRKIRSL